jgi:hypothetical protein
MQSDLEKRVENLEKVIRENFNNVGSKIVRIDAKPDETSSCGGYIYIYCGSCNRSLGNFAYAKPSDLNFCQQCGTKLVFDNTLDKALEQLKHAKDIYDRTQPLKKEIEDLKELRKKR